MPDDFVRERNVILVVLLLLAGLCWAILIWQARNTDMAMRMSATMGLVAPVFLAIWVVMMVAMMFPAVAPMIVLFRKVQISKESVGRHSTPVAMFVAGYLALWTAVGLVAYGLGVAGESLAAQHGLTPTAVARGGALLLVGAGIYQLTPLKSFCLSKCRTPLGFLITSWRDGHWGAFRMGGEHGLYCLGCCWLLFAILFPLGLMNIVAMALLTALIFAEKTLFYGSTVAKAAAIFLVVFGAVVFFKPTLMPGFMDMGSM